MGVPRLEQLSLSLRSYSVGRKTFDLVRTTQHNTTTWKTIFMERKATIMIMNSLCLGSCWLCSWDRKLEGWRNPLHISQNHRIVLQRVWQSVNGYGGFCKASDLFDLLSSLKVRLRKSFWESQLQNVHLPECPPNVEAHRIQPEESGQKEEVH